MKSGPMGSTVTKRVPLVSDRGTEQVDLVSVVNVATDPALAERALAGKLHELEDGSYLAEPFVYHDPAAQLFVLVVPEVMRHRRLLEQARLLERLHQAAGGIPSYFADAKAVIGVPALKRLIERGALLDARERQLSDKQNDVSRAEKLLETTRAELEAIERELRGREEELDLRFDRLREREQARLGRAMPSPSEVAPDNLLAMPEDVEDEEDDEEEAAVDVEPTRVIDTASLKFRPDEPDSVSEFDVVDLEAGDAELVDDVEIEDLDDGKIISLDVVETIDDESLESVLLEEEEEEPEDAIAAPDNLISDASAQMVSQEREDGVWLFVRLQEGDEPDAYERETELLVQYVAVEERPVVLLALTDFSQDRASPRRAGLDPRNESDLRILERIRGGETIHVAFYSPSGRYRRRTQTTIGARATNLTTILERAKRATGNLDSATALERALAAAPPVQMKGHPFVEEASATTAKEAMKSLKLLSKWADPDKRDLAVLALSIPRDLVEDSFRRVLSDALGFGLALPNRLMARAVSMGIANEPGELVLKAIDNFRATASRGDALTVAEVGRNWEQLLDLAHGNELSVDPDAHEQAERDIARARGESLHPPSGDVDLDDVDDEAILSLVDHPRRRLEVALELVKRGEENHLRAVSLSMRKMPREEVLLLVAAMLRKGEASADALVDGLGAKKTFVRHACALGLGQLGLRRSLGPLVQLLQIEPTDVWREVAWVLGGFGTAALRFVERAAKNPRGPDERLHHAMAHMLAVDEKSLDKLKLDDDRVRSALDGARTVRAEVDSYRGARSAEAAPSTITGFSHAFEQEVAK